MPCKRHSKLDLTTVRRQAGTGLDFIGQKVAPSEKYTGINFLQDAAEYHIDESRKRLQNRTLHTSQ